MSIAVLTRLDRPLHRIMRCLIALSLGCALPALATTETRNANPDAEFWTSVAIGSNEAFFALPQGFPPTPSTIAEEPSGYQAVYFPPGHHEGNWTEKLRLMRMPGQIIGANGENPAQALLAALAERVKVACPAEFFFTAYPTGNSRRAAAHMGCKGNRARETFAIHGYYNVLLGADSSYILSRERRLPANAATLQLGAGVLERWRKEADSLTICRKGVRCMPQPGAYSFAPAPAAR